MKDIICKIEYTDNNKSKYSGNPKDISKSANKFYEKRCTKERTSKAATAEFLSKIPNIKKKSNEQFNLCEAKISLAEIIKSISSQINHKYAGNDGLTTEFYKHISNEIALVLLDVYDSCGKLGTMGVTSKTGIIYLSYIKKVVKGILQTTDPYTTILKNRLQKALHTTVNENQLLLLKDKTILHTFSFYFTYYS